MIARTLLLSACLFGCARASAADDFAALDEASQNFKRDVLALNRDLLVLEEQTLTPDAGQIAVFVAMDLGAFFDVETLRVQIDGRQVSEYHYTDPEIEALIKGGTQRLYVGNLADGPHELVAVFTGRGPHGRDYRRAASLQFDKARGPRRVELRIVDTENRQQPDFAARIWE